MIYLFWWYNFEMKYYKCPGGDKRIVFRIGLKKQEPLYLQMNFENGVINLSKSLFFYCL